MCPLTSFLETNLDYFSHNPPNPELLDFTVYPHAFIVDNFK